MDIKFDFRTKLLVIVLTMSLVAVLTSDILIYTLLGVLSVYLVIQGFGRQTIQYLLICGGFIVLRFLSDGQGITILMPDMFLFMVLRILMMVMAAQPVMGMPPGEVVAVFKKIHAPDGIALPVTFMLRFFPTVRSEFSDVFAALRLRKLLSWKHPLEAMEYTITPIIFRSSRMAEELAASAESRGISNPGKHTCRRKIAFQKRDWMMCVIAVCVTALYFVLERTVT
ncbi:MAG: energy-coupling factor transporter transmembrane component T [bacterium]|nr:energy-coupling factor transporter transmembrane component T [bacterium]